MRIVKQGFEIISMPTEDELLRVIEVAGRTCYKSEDKITEESSVKFARRMLRNWHLSVIEHGAATVRIICDRGTSHGLVRHRLASFSQESTQYCNYANDRFGNEISVIAPDFKIAGGNAFHRVYELWRHSVEQAEQSYLALIASGCSTSEARSVLPTCLKTEVIITANMREWRHIFEMRCGGNDHPQIRALMQELLCEFTRRLPILFQDLCISYVTGINAAAYDAIIRRKDRNEE